MASRDHARIKRRVRATPRPMKKRPQFSCRDATDLIGDYLADTLDSFERRSFENHLSGCADCVAFLATYKRTVELTRAFLAEQSLRTKPTGLKLRPAMTR